MTASTRRLLIALAAATLPITASASYVHREEVREFIREMSSAHGFDDAQLYALLDRAEHHPRVIELIRPPATPGVRSWQRYRARFLDRTRIDGGVAFWQEHAGTIRRASEQYGVPEEVIVAIIGVETLYGRHTGNFETLSALATLAFDYPPRAPLFRRELEQLLLLAREQRRDPMSYFGSYAGAVGYPQFLPSSVRNYAVDFDGDGRIDFDADPVDAIGSVANYLHAHGWQAGRPVAERARIAPTAAVQPLVDAGIDPILSPETLTAAGIARSEGGAPAETATLVDLASPGAETEYWLGYRNFYVITRYNRSSFYAMAVFQLAEALRQANGR
ncbi:lytic murein transglycosylase B [Thauera sp. CAU 1555]|uniref:Lytic murein transglycosylase B n=1 Tax=Thauera sedimentorum TaxID=2767595 RepID=A0ABR9B640_9RHOO|nr:lytic murein transglycosylase B [Thauera sedimentorum]MBC9070737.1 lytic murein transglycosylase B [Thauera sedimentorum]MBD8501656.1 lytic murein transglycosylase B [Thauera sedimentorum]